MSASLRAPEGSTNSDQRGFATQNTSLLCCARQRASGASCSDRILIILPGNARVEERSRGALQPKAERGIAAFGHHAANRRATIAQLVGWIVHAATMPHSGCAALQTPATAAASAAAAACAAVVLNVYPTSLLPHARITGMEPTWQTGRLSRDSMHMPPRTPSSCSTHGRRQCARCCRATPTGGWAAGCTRTAVGTCT